MNKLPNPVRCKDCAFGGPPEFGDSGAACHLEPDTRFFAAAHWCSRGEPVAEAPRPAALPTVPPEPPPAEVRVRIKLGAAFQQDGWIGDSSNWLYWPHEGVEGMAIADGSGAAWRCVYDPNAVPVYLRDHDGVEVLS